MKRVTLVLILLLTPTVFPSAFGNVLIVNELPLKTGVALPQEDVGFINTLVTYSLNDISDVFPYSCIDVLTAQEWYNSVVDIINATNTNVVIVKGKPSVPKPIPKIQIKSLNAPTISALTKVIPDIKGVLTASYVVSKTSLRIDLQYLDQSGKVVSRKSLEIPLALVRDRDYVLLQVKEAIVDLLNAWRYYYYDPKRPASVTISIKPPVKDFSIIAQPYNIQLKAGKNTIGEGEYTIIVSAPGYQPVVTNLYIPAGGNISLSFSLQKSVPLVSPVPTGVVYIDTDVKGVPTIVAEGGISGTTPLFTNLTEGVKNVIFQQTPITPLKSVQIVVKPNEFNYYFFNLERVGAGVNIVADNGSFVVVNRRLEGMITTGSYYKSLSRGIHTITVFKHGFEPVRTNLNITSDERITLELKLKPKKVPLFIVTPQTREAIVSFLGKNVGVTPYSLMLEHGKEAKVDILAQDVGFNNVSFSITPYSTKINSLVQNLSPLYGDLLVITEPYDAIVKIDGRIMGKTGLDGLLLRSISARKSFVFVQKEGYRTVRTNVHILPNVQNSLFLRLKEAPIKLYINTLPVQNVQVYFNDEYYGENDSVVNVELGNFVMKLLKRGFKTVFTNVSFPEKVPTVIPLTFQMVPGMSEIEVIESASNRIIEFDKLISNGNYFEAYELIRRIKRDLSTSEYTNYSVEVMRLYSLADRREKEIAPRVEFHLLTKELEEVLTKADGLVKANSPDEARKLVDGFISKVDASSLTKVEKEQLLSKVKDKQREIVLMAVLSKVSNVVVQAERMVAKGEKSSAISLYEEAIKIIDEHVVGVPEFREMLEKVRGEIRSKYRDVALASALEKVSNIVLQAERVVAKGDKFSALPIYEEAIKTIDEYKVSFPEFAEVLEKTKTGVRNRYREIALDGVMERISNIIVRAEEVAAKGDKLSAFSQYEEAVKVIDEYRVKFPEFDERLTKLREASMSNYVSVGIEVLSNKVRSTLVTAEELEKRNNLTNAIDVVSSTLKEIKLSKLYYLEEVKRMEEVLNKKYDELVYRSLEEAQMGEVREVFNEIKPILKEARRLISIEEYDSAIRKYQEAIKIIEISEFRENPFLRKLKEEIIGYISEAEIEKKKKEEIRLQRLRVQEEIERKRRDLPWWVRMHKAWVGVGFEVGGAMLVPPKSDFYITNMNIPAYGKLHISFLPIMGLAVGGFYNVNTMTVSSNSAHLLWMGLGQVELRIPIVKQFSFFGAFGSGVGQSILEPLRFRLGQDFILNAGIDLKFSWFGMRLSYDMVFFDNFGKNQLGGSFGIIIWATED